MVFPYVVYILLSNTSYISFAIFPFAFYGQFAAILSVFKLFC